MGSSLGKSLRFLSGFPYAYPVAYPQRSVFGGSGFKTQ